MLSPIFRIIFLRLYRISLASLHPPLLQIPLSRFRVPIPLILFLLSLPRGIAIHQTQPKPVDFIDAATSYGRDSVRYRGVNSRSELVEFAVRQGFWVLECLCFGLLIIVEVVSFDFDSDLTWEIDVSLKIYGAKCMTNSHRHLSPSSFPR